MRKGFAPIIIIIAVAIVVVLGGGALYYAKLIKAPPQKACTQEAKQCLDGSYVGRTGPNCEFAVCPAASSTADTSGWKTYTDSDYNFAFRYPAELALKQFKSPDADYGAEEITLSDKGGVRYTFYVTTSDSIDRWNTRDLSQCRREGCSAYQDLNCEATSTRCSEDSYGDVQGSVLGRRGIAKDGDVGLEMNFSADYHGDDDPIGSDGRIHVALGTISESDKHYLDLFGPIFGTLKFVSSTVSVDTSDWKTYRNEKYGFEIKYPQDWIKIEEDDIEGFFISLQTTITKFDHPEQSYNILISKTPATSLEEWFENRYRDKRQDSVSKKSIEFNSYPAMAISDPYTIGAVSGCDGDTIIILRNGYAYQLDAPPCEIDLTSRIASTFKFAK